jgi:hypothetical protein
MNQELIYMGLNIYLAKVTKISVTGYEYSDYQIINKELKA